MKHNSSSSNDHLLAFSLLVSLALVTVLVAKVGSLALIELQVSRHPASFLLVDGAHQGAGSLANNFNL